MSTIKRRWRAFVRLEDKSVLGFVAGTVVTSVGWMAFCKLAGVL